LAFESLESRTLLSADPIGVSVLLLPAPAEAQIVVSANLDHASDGDDHGASLPAPQSDFELSNRSEQAGLGFPQPLSFADTAFGRSERDEAETAPPSSIATCITMATAPQATAAAAAGLAIAKLGRRANVDEDIDGP
jgi:hypothetical protein